MQGLTRKYWLLGILLLAIPQINCPSPPKGYREFRRLPLEKQEEQFKTFPIEKQIDFFDFCLMKTSCEKFEKDAIAMQGKSALPYLLDRMERSFESDKYMIAVILESMNENYYKISEDEAAKTKLRQIVDKMSDPVWKDMTKGALKEII